MKTKRILSAVLMLALAICFVFGAPTVAHAASEGGNVGNAISNFFTGILDCLVMIVEGIIGLFAILIQLIVDFVMLIVGLFT